MRDSSQLTPLSTFCKQAGPINWIPLLLSSASSIRIDAFSLKIYLKRGHMHEKLPKYRRETTTVQ